MTEHTRLCMQFRRRLMDWGDAGCGADHPVVRELGAALAARGSILVRAMSWETDEAEDQDAAVEQAAPA